MSGPGQEKLSIELGPVACLLAEASAIVAQWNGQATRVDPAKGEARPDRTLAGRNADLMRLAQLLRLAASEAEMEHLVLRGHDDPRAMEVTDR